MDELNEQQVPTGAVFSRKRLIVGGVVIVIIAVAVFIAVSRMKSDPQAEAKREAAQIVASVRKLMVLPDNEEPIIATVSDPSQLKNQPFFQNAKKGDKVLIYNLAKKAILYSPELNRVVDVAPLNIGSPSPTPKK